MPIAGLGLHVIAAIFFAIHAIRTGQDRYWVYILFIFPGLGSVVYFVAIYLPQSKLERGLRQVSRAAVRSLDPGKALREARLAFDLTPTAQNRMQLAEALLDAGQTAEAVSQFDACLQGPLANDPEIRLGAARAHLLNGETGAAELLLRGLQDSHKDFRPETVLLALAEVLGKSGQQEAAHRCYVDAVARFGTAQVHAEFAIWAMSVNDMATAEQQRAALEQIMKHWTRSTRQYNRDLINRVNAAFTRQAKP